MDIEYISYGLGYNEGGRIKLNKVLLTDNIVYDEILSHELRHTKDKFTFKDLWNDMIPFSFRTFVFMLKHPSTWWSISPIWYNGKDLCVDFSSIVFFGLGLIVGGVGWILML